MRDPYLSFDVRTRKKRRAELYAAVTCPVGEFVKGPLKALLMPLFPEFPVVDSVFGAGATHALAVLMGSGTATMSTLRIVLRGRTPEARRNRAQALVAFPLLEFLWPSEEAPDHSPRAALAKVIDDGSPLLRELPQVLGCKPWMIRYLRGKTEMDMSPYGRGGLDALLPDMHWLTPELAPKEVSDYSGLSLISTFMRDGHEMLALAAQRVVLRSGWDALTPLVDDIGHVRDYLSFLFEIGVGLTPYVDGIGRAVDAAFGYPTLSKLAMLSRRWHETEVAIRADLGPPEDSADLAEHWPQLFAETIPVGGLTMHCLSTPEALHAEGTAQRHCVGSYVASCRSGRSHIISIRREGVRVATAEFALRTRGAKMNRFVAVVQVYGPRNTPPTTEIKRATRQLAQSLGARDLSAFPVDCVLVDRDIEIPDETWCLKQVLLKEGPEGLARYRPCLQPNPSEPGLWVHLFSRIIDAKLTENRRVRG